VARAKFLRDTILYRTDEVSVLVLLNCKLLGLVKAWDVGVPDLLRILLARCNDVVDLNSRATTHMIVASLSWSDRG